MSLYAGLVHLRLGLLISGAIITRIIAPEDSACQQAAARTVEELTTTGFLYCDHGVKVCRVLNLSEVPVLPRPRPR